MKTTCMELAKRFLGVTAILISAMSPHATVLGRSAHSPGGQSAVPLASTARHNPGAPANPSPACSSPAYQAYGIDFSPYIDGQDPNINPQVSADQILARLQLIAPCTSWVRSFSSTNGLEATTGIAHSLNLKIAAGAWLGRDLQKNQTEINNLIALGQQQNPPEMLIVGSEALLRNDVTDSQLIDYLHQVKQAVPNLPVTTADISSVLLLHQNVIAACDVVFVNYYPYWSGVSIDQAMTTLNNWHQEVIAVAGGKPIIVSETGWPSAGNTVGNAVPSPANASYYFLDFVSWARANNVAYFYFEALDEAWKANYEGPQGAHWGILDKDGNLKAGFDQVFNGITVSDNWDCTGVVGGTGTPSISLTYVPPYGDSSDSLAGQILHESPASFDVAVYLSVNGGATWWIKPYYNQPITHCQCNGTWTANVVTGGEDQLATNYAAFLIPNTYSPPALRGQPLPNELYQNSVANVLVSRSTNSLGGVVQDQSNNAINGVSMTLSGAENQTAITVGGKYSFYNLATNGPYTAAPSAPGYTFNPPSQTFTTISGAQTASFVGTANADLAVSQTASPSGVVGLGQNLTYKIFATNGGPGSASNVTLTDTLPSGVTLVSVTTDTGACSGTQTITCNLGSLPRSGMATVTVVVGATAPGSLTNTITVAADQPDATPGDNSSTLVTIAGIPVPYIDQPLVPTAAAPGGPGFTLTVSGTGFVPNSMVNWNGAPLSTTFISSAQLTAAVPAANIATAGTASVTVTSPNSPPENGTSNVAFFSVTDRTTSLVFANAPSSPIAVGNTPFPVAVGDFNGDGRLDMAVVNFMNRNITILLGDGTGKFTAVASSPTTGSGPFSIAVGDFNGDGRQDLAVANAYDNNLTILLGNGDGTFTPSASTPPAGSAPSSLAVADFNGDGRQDLVVASSASSNVKILLGNGDGTFTPTASSPPTGADPYWVATGDFNGDGKPDLAVANYGSNNVTILLGNGDGTFTATAASPSTGSEPTSLALADFNGDGKLDIAVTNRQDNNLTILLGDGTGNFNPSGSSPATGLDPYGVAAGDFNGDGALDMAVANFQSNSLTILLGDGSGNFAALASSPATGSGPYSVVLGDFNGDGRLDMAATNEFAGTVSVLLQVPAVALNPTSLSFNNQPVGTTSTALMVTLSNAGSAPLTVSTIGPPVGDFGDFHNCPISPATLAAGASCTINVTFTPTMTGTRNGTLAITDNSDGVSGSQQSVPLTGAGINPGATPSPNSLSFGNQVVNTPSAPKKVTLTSTGTTSLNISSTGISGTNVGDFSASNNCPANMPPGARCAVSVTFMPTALGPRTATLAVNDNAANSPQFVQLFGAGVLPFVLSPAARNFGNQAENTTSAPKTVTLRNYLNAALSISSITASGDFAQTNTCSASVPAKGRCTINVSFTPAATGIRTGILTVADNASNSPQTVSLTGMGLPQATISPASLTFAAQKVGTMSSTKVVTLTNNLNTVLAITTITFTGEDPSDFTQTNTCGSSLVAKSHCTISVTFGPIATGTRTATLDVNDSANNNPQTVSLKGVGQ